MKNSEILIKLHLKNNMRNTLDEIAKFYGTDKSSEIHDYCRKYEKYLSFHRYDNIKILEIGVLGGQSLRMWKEYFLCSHILGIDITPECKQYEEDRIQIEIGSQIDEEFLKRISEQYGPFDMILDDGSHVNSHVIYSFEHLFDAVRSGGVYIVEDACTSYWASWGGERYKKGTTIEYFKGVADEVNFFGEAIELENKGPHRRDDYLLAQFKRKGYNYIGTQIESLNFLNSIIIITKR